MSILHWAIKDILVQVTATGVEIKVFSFQPCHLWMRWTTTFPQVHSVPVISRGLAMYTDRRFCFVAYRDNEQAEGDDTYVHTFLKEPWPACETRYFYFHGKMGGEKSRSTSCIFSYHRIAPPYGPPVTKKYYSQWHPATTACDGEALRNVASTSWAAIHDGAGTLAYNNLVALRVYIATHLPDVGYAAIDRAILCFDTSDIPPGSKFTSARLNVLAAAKYNVMGLPLSINVFQSHPLNPALLVPADYQNIDAIPLSTPIAYADWEIGTRQDFPFNPAGLQALTPGGITQLALREATFDAPDVPCGWGTFGENGFYSRSRENADPNLRPYLEVTYRPKL